MQTFEVRAVMKYQYLKSKENWEQARLISYLIAQTNSTKKLTFRDIIEFPWEKDSIDLATTISKEDIDRLREKARQFQNDNLI